MSKPKKIQYNGSSKIISYIVNCINWLLDNGSGGSDVLVNPIQTTGTKIAEITVDNTTYELYAPLGGGSSLPFDFEIDETDGGINIIYPSQGGGGGGGSVTSYGLSMTGNILSIVPNGGESSVTLPGATITIDDALSDTSENPLQNKVITARITSIETTLGNKANSNNVYSKTETDNLLDNKQDTLTAGDNITIQNNVISSTGSDVSITPTLSAGEKIADYEIDGIAGELFAPEGGSAGNMLVDSALNENDVLYTSDVITNFNQTAVSYQAKKDCYAFVDYTGSTTTSMFPIVNGVALPTSYYPVRQNYLIPLKKGDVITSRHTSDNESCYFKMVIYGRKPASEIVAPIIYSEEEREVGVWVDNKPLYEKTTLNNSGISSLETWTEIVDLGSDCDIKIFKGYIITAVGEVPFDYSGQGASVDYIKNMSSSIVKSLGKVSAYLNNDSNWLRNLPIRATVQYTKTTDVAGSGSYTTLGVPTVHYSTDEQVIGTWIDGKPLYQKTIYGIPFTSNERVVYPLNIDTENCWFDFTMSYIYGSWGHRQPWYSFDVFEANGILYFQTPHSSGSLCAVIKYTKTTD